MTARAGSLSVLTLLALSFVAQGGDNPAVPSYKFKPGQELTFHSSSQFKYGEEKTAGEHGSTGDYTVWVTRANPDGSFHLILRDKNVFSQTFNGKKSDQPVRTTMAYADVFPDGRVLPNKTIRYQDLPGALFPQLPRNESEARAGWESERNFDKVVCKPASGAGKFVFDTETISPFNKIYLMTNNARQTFDPTKGLITRSDSKSSQVYGFNGKGAGTLELVSVKEIPLPELKTFTEGADKYFEVADAYEEKTAAASKAPPEKAKELLATAAKDLKTAASEMKNDELKRVLEEKFKEHERMAGYYVEEAKSRAKIMGKAAPEFETTSIDGKNVKLADLRGQVVVLDFWYRGCGWCIKAMPQMNQLAEDFAGQPVTIFGMNTDRDEKDAKFVMEKMELKYPSLKAEGIPQRFGVRGFPTLIIIDQQGKVHDIHVGYSPTLREDVAKQIRDLLKKA